MPSVKELVLESSIVINDSKYYFDFTSIVNDKEKLSTIVDEFYEAIKTFECDALLGSGYGGTQLVAAIVAKYPEFNAIIVRSTPHLTQARSIEGDIETPQKILIIDDAVFSGKTVYQILAIIGEHAKKIVGCVVIYDDWRPLATRQIQQKLFPIKWLVGRRELGLTRDAFRTNKKLLIEKTFLHPNMIRWADYSGNQSDWKMKSTPKIYKNLIINAIDTYKVQAHDLQTGEVVWSISFPGSIREGSFNKGIIQNLNVASDNYLYVGAYDGTLKKIDPLIGATSWSIKLGECIHSTPVYCAERDWVIVNVEDFYFKSNVPGGYLAALQASTGKIVWTYKHTHYPPSEPLLHDDKIYTSANDGSVICLDLEGKLIWKNIVKAEVRTPGLMHKKHLYVIDTNGWLYKLNAKTGKIVWEFRACSSGWMVTPTLHDGKILVWDGLLRTQSNAFAYDEEGVRTMITSLRATAGGVLSMSTSEVLIASSNMMLAYFKDGHKEWETNYRIVGCDLASCPPAVDLKTKTIAFNLRHGGLQVYNLS